MAKGAVNVFLSLWKFQTLTIHKRKIYRLNKTIDIYGQYFSIFNSNQTQMFRGMKLDDMLNRQYLKLLHCNGGRLWAVIVDKCTESLWKHPHRVNRATPCNGTSEENASEESWPQHIHTHTHRDSELTFETGHRAFLLRRSCLWCYRPKASHSGYNAASKQHVPYMNNKHALQWVWTACVVGYVYNTVRCRASVLRPNTHWRPNIQLLLVIAHGRH